MSDRISDGMLSSLLVASARASVGQLHTTRYSYNQHVYMWLVVIEICRSRIAYTRVSGKIKHTTIAATPAHFLLSVQRP